MFEAPQKAEPSVSKGLWIGMVVIVLLGAVGGYFFIESKGSGARQGSTGSVAAPKGDPDPVRDLKIQRTTMDKDRNGTSSVWVVTVENKSAGYGYSKIQYETTYVGADGHVLMTNKGTLPDAIGPGEQKNCTVNDPLYPAGTVRYMMKITAATAQ